MDSYLNENLIISHAISLFLKLKRKGENLNEYSPYINAIKHGDYSELIKLNGVKTPPMVVYSPNGIRYSENDNQYEFEFEGLLKSSYALIQFYEKHYKSLGDFQDELFTDNDFLRLGEFEVAIRMHSKNYGLYDEREKLEVVIDKLALRLKMTTDDKSLLHKGRVILNNIKHHPNRIIEIEKLRKSFMVLDKYKIRIVC
jgi:hypothetical protein